MATDQEVQDAEKQRKDNDDLTAQLAILAAIFGGSGEIDIKIERDGNTFQLSRLKAVLRSGNANEDQMVTDVDAAALVAVGATDVVVGSIRKALKDLEVLHDADIAAT